MLQRISPEHITQTAAVLLTLGILWALVQHRAHRLEQPVSDPGVRISLEEPPAPAPPKVEPPTPKPRTTPVRLRAMVPAVTADALAPVMSYPVQAPADVPVIAAAEPSDSAPPVSRASVEAAYAAAVRQNIDARTTVPDTAEYRMLRPHGSVEVRFFLDRSGNPSAVALQRSSGSHILDAQALHIVSSGRYPPFPATAFTGEARHPFLVTIEFRS